MLNQIAAIHGTGVAAVTNSYESISTVTVGAGGQSSIAFTSIPNTYKHLQLRFSIQSNRGTYGTDDLTLRVNSDSGSNYAWHQLLGNGSTTLVYALASQTSIELNNALGTGVSSTQGAAVVDFLDYANTSKNKTIRTLSGTDINGLIASFGGRVGLQSGLWMNSGTAISSITLTPISGTLFNQNSKAALYGIKG